MRVIILFFATLLFASNITSTKKEINQNSIVLSKMNTKLDILAKEIRKKRRSIYYLNKQIQKLNEEIKKLQTELKNSNETLTRLNDLKKGFEKKALEIENEIIDFLSNNYYLDTQEIDNINDLIYNEIGQKIIEEKSKKIAKILNENKEIIQNISKINEKIAKIQKKQQELLEKKKKQLALYKKRKNEIALLKRKEKIYKQKIKNLIAKQKALKKRLVSLNVIKNQQKPSNTKLAYNGSKTIPPLKGKIIKKFGSYIEPIYKIRVNNDSITIKPYKKNEVVRAIMPGKVIYIGKSKDKHVIVIKHNNGLFSIYANLDKISPLLKRGSYVKKGQIIARVLNSLEFEITYKDKPINPLKVIYLR